MVKPSSYPAIGCPFFGNPHDLHRSFVEVSKLVSKALEERLPIAAASGDFASRSSVVRGGVHSPNHNFLGDHFPFPNGIGLFFPTFMGI